MTSQDMTLPGTAPAAPLWRRPQALLGRIRPALDGVLRPGRTGPRRLSLALQGGGSLGAFTWGVLDRLLEDDGVVFDAVSGASAGAVNAVVLADGLAAGGRPEARRRLERAWQRPSEAGSQI